MITYLLVAYFISLMAGMYYSLAMMDSKYPRIKKLSLLLFLLLTILLAGGLFNVMNLDHPGHLL